MCILMSRLLSVPAVLALFAVLWPTVAKVQSLPARMAGIQISNVTCGSTDVTSALQNALNTFSAAGGGHYMLPSAPCIVGTAFSLTIPPHVAVIGGDIAGGYQVANAYATSPYTLLVGENQVVMSSNSELSGVNVIRQGLPSPTTLRGFITAAQGFSGTGISCPSSSTDVKLHDVFVTGFALGVSSACDRMHMYNVRGDDTSGVLVSACSDTCNFEDIEFWPFIANPYMGAPEYQNTIVSGAANLGGVIELTFGSVPSTPIVTGDILVVANVGGVPAASGRWTVTAVDGRHLTLNGSTFAGAYTSGGTAWLNGALRTGTAFDVETNQEGGPFIARLTTFNYSTGLHYGGGTVSAGCMQCWIDGFTFAGNYDPQMVGVLEDGTGTGYNSYEGFVNVSGPAFVGDAKTAFTFRNTQISAFAWQAGVNSIQVNKGGLIINGGFIFTGGGTHATIYVSDASTFVNFVQVVNPNYAAFNFQSTPDCSKVTVDGAIGPCVWTPMLAGSAVAGTSTAAIGYPAGYYTVAPGGSVTAWGHLSTTAFSGASGPLYVYGLPIVGGAENPKLAGSCLFSRVNGLTLTPGFSQISGSIASTQSGIAINQIGSVVGSAAVNSATQVAAATELQFACFYLR